MPDVTMPQLGETVVEGTITRWLKSVGDRVSRDEPLFEVSTDKVDTEVPSPSSGILQEIIVQEGDTVEVGARLAVIAESVADGESPAARGPAATVPPSTAPPQAQPPTAAATPSASPTGGTSAAPEAPSSPPTPPPTPGFSISAPPAPTTVPRPTPTSEPAAPSEPTASVASGPSPGAGGAATPSAEGSVQASPPSAPPGGGAEGGHLLLSPVVRRLLDEHGIDPSDVPATGVGGRLTREDVLRFIDAQRAASRTAPSTASPAAPASVPSKAESSTAPATAAAPSATATPPASSAGREAALVSMHPSRTQVVPLSNIRRRTAEHMVRSKATSPHAYVTVETDFEAVERVRREWGPRFRAEEGFSLTYLPFVARATVEALREYPHLNASVTEDSLVVYQDINLGIAVDLDHEGLIVPVVHRAEEITLRGIARRIRDLADRARTKQLRPDDVLGGTFSITNDGPFGTYFTVPIINQPQVGILSTDGVKRRPVVVELPDGSESIAIHSVGLIGLAWDHRAVDGAYASSFLRRVKDVLMTRDWASEL